MDHLLADSRDEAAIPRLQAHGVPALAQLLASHQSSSDTEAASTLLDALRAVRNLGALGGCVAKSLAQYKLPEVVCGVLSTLVQAGPGDQALAVKAALQGLANMATGNSAAAVTIWHGLFPDLFLVTLTSYPALHHLVAAILYRGMHDSPDSRRQITTSTGVQLIQTLVKASSQEPSELWTQLLLTEVAILENRLLDVLDNLSIASQAIALHLIYLDIERRGEDLWTASLPATGIAQALCQLLPMAARACVASGAHTAVMECAPSSAAMIDRLEWALKIIVAITSTDPGGELGSADDVSFQLFQCGLVDLVAAALKALPAIQHPGNAPSPEQLAASGATFPAATPAAPGPQPSPPDGALATSPNDDAPCWPTQTLYPGYRKDLVAVLANLSFGRPPVQLHVSSIGGVELLLQQCQIDDENPMVREYALWGIRNLCTNPSVQQQIRSLEVQGVADHEVLSRAGYSLGLDARSRRPCLTRS